MSNFTSGPWALVDPGHPASAIEKHDCWTIEAISTSNEMIDVEVRRVANIGLEAEAKATANLIVAAPDMLEALKNIENDDEHMPPSAWELIQNAIAKAEGKENGGTVGNE